MDPSFNFQSQCETENTFKKYENITKIYCQYFSDVMRTVFAVSFLVNCNFHLKICYGLPDSKIEDRGW